MRAFAICILTTLSGWFFYHDSMEVARKTHDAIRLSLVNHPEFIPEAEDIRLVSSGFDALLADFYWLSSIQYVGGNAISAEYKRYLYRMLDLVTDLSPSFDYPYEIGLLLLPDYNPRYESLSAEEQRRNVNEAIELGKKGMENSCDAEKIRKIEAEANFSKVWTAPEYADPCRNPMIPYYLAYVEYWNRKNAAAASAYYRIAAANRDAPKGARIMSAIMRGKGEDRQKAILMFLSLAESVEGKKQTACKEFSEEMRQILTEGFEKNLVVSAEFLKQVENFRRQIVGELGEEHLAVGDADSFCSTYLNKAVRELNLAYLEAADKAYAAETGKKPADARDLYDWGVISYLPRDFQKFDDQSEVIYVREDDGRWDYATGRY